MDGLVDSGFVVLGGPLADEQRVVLAIEAGSGDEVRATLGEDPWSGAHLVVDSVERWTIRLDGRRRSAAIRASGVVFWAGWAEWRRSKGSR